MAEPNTRISAVLQQHEAELFADWLSKQMASPTLRPDLLKESELREQGTLFLRLLREAVAGDNLADVQRPNWSRVREFLVELSRSRALQGFTPSETATFILSLKEPLFMQLRAAHAGQQEALFDDLWRVTGLIDKLALFTTDAYQKTREEIIGRQQNEMFELSSPVIELWAGVLGLPLIGTLDSKRSQLVMESLLQRLAETQSEVVIIDITGVPAVDTMTAQHLLKTVAATRLMGAECIISGIRPQIAQTIVHLGVDLGDVPTKSTLAGALAVAFKRRGLAVVSSAAPTAVRRPAGEAA